MRVSDLKVFGDSTLVIHQLRKERKPRDAELVPYQLLVSKKKERERFRSIHFGHFPCVQNQIVDTLAIPTTMFQLKSTLKSIQLLSV